MTEYYCTNCKAEFMGIDSAFKFCAYCKTNTLVKKNTENKKKQKDYKTKKSSKFYKDNSSKNDSKNLSNHEIKFRFLEKLSNFEYKKFTVIILLVLLLKVFLHYFLYRGISFHKLYGNDIVRNTDKLGHHFEALFKIRLELFVPAFLIVIIFIWIFKEYDWFKKLTNNSFDNSKKDEEANQIKLTSKIDNDSTSNKKEDVNFTSQNKTSSSEIIKKLYPKLKGIDFELISPTPKGESPENFFTSDIDGKWFFSVHNFAMIFKSFSNENYEKGLSDLLKANGLALNAKVEESTHYYIQGDGFKIEKPKSSGTNLIIITNEKVAHEETVKLRSLDKLNKVDVKWIKGINKIYDGNDALSRFNLSKDLKNIPMYFKEDDIDYIAIHIPTLNVAKMLINQLIEKNKFENDFKKFDDEDGWEYIHESDKMVIGYLPENQAVRINNKLF